MTGEGAAGTQRVRLLKASAVVLAFLCAVPGVDAVVGVLGQHEAAASAEQGIDARGIIANSDPFEALEEIEGALEADASDVPQSYIDEIGILPDASDVRVDSSGKVVGYTVEGSESDVFRLLSEQMGEKGWIAVPLGGVTGATFVCQGQNYSQVVVTCTQVGSKTSVVTRCMDS